MKDKFTITEIDCNSPDPGMQVRAAFATDFASEALINASLVSKSIFMMTVQDENANVVGIAGVYKKYYIFYDLYIALDKKVRGQGIGGELLASILSFVEMKNILLFIQTYECEKYRNAIFLYHKYNFAVCSKYNTKILMKQRSSRKWQVLVRKWLFQFENKLRSYKQKWSK